MALEIFKLVGSIMVDNTAANESIAKTDENAQGLGSTLADGMKKAGEFGLAVVGAATTAATGMMSLASSTASTSDEIQKASQRMNVDYKTYQQLAYAANQSGVEMSTLERAAKSLEGTDLNLDDALEQIMALGTEEERSAMAAELFGETVAYNLRPILVQSGEEFAALQQNAEDLGLIMSDEMVDAGVTLGDTISDITQSFQAMGTQLGGSLLPVVQEVLDLVVANIPTIQGIISSLIPVLVSMAQAILPPLMEMAQNLLPIIVDLINNLMPIITTIMQTVLPVIVELLNTLLPIVGQLLEFLAPLVTEVLSAVMPILQPIMDILSPIISLLTALLEPLMSLLEIILPPLIDIVGAFIEIISNNLNTAITFITGVIETIFIPIFDTVSSVIGTVKDFVLDSWENISDGIGGFVEMIGNVVEDGFEALIGFVKAPINAIIGFINAFINGINKINIDVPSWVTDLTGIDNIGFNIPNIPYLAKGGTLDTDGSAIVGEAGAELVDLPQGAKVTPLTRASGEGGTIEDKFNQMVELLQMLVDKTGTSQIVLDTGILVGEIAPEMDNELGKLSSQNARSYI